MPRLTVLLPCYNEEASLPSLLGRLAAQQAALSPAWELDALVVDDGSRDSTAEIAKHGVAGLRVRLVQHGRNLGLGAALLTGLSSWLAQAGQSQDALAVMDADLTPSPRAAGKAAGRAGGYWARDPQVPGGWKR